MAYGYTVILFLHIFIIKSSSAAKSNIVVAPKLRAINFGKTVSNASLIAGVFLRARETTEEECAMNCVISRDCVSYNFRAPSDKYVDDKNCELSNTDRFAANNCLLPRTGYTHRGIKTDCETESSCGKEQICVPNYEDNTVRCEEYKKGDRKKPCDVNPAIEKCSDYLKNGYSQGGVYNVQPDDKGPFAVSCDMTTDGGGWTLLQRRQDGSVSFERRWNEYKNGFGDLNGNFWIGNDKIHRLTISQEMVLRFDLEDFDGNKVYAEYQNVTVLGESEKYRLYFGDYTGTAGDSLRVHYGMAFSTTDRDNDIGSKENCALNYKGGWWYNYCYNVNINGLYIVGGKNNASGMSWTAWKGNHYSMKTTEMKVRPKK